MNKKLFFIFIILIIIFMYKNSLKDENIIPNDAIRFRIIANSNSIEDQNIKIQVRNEVQNKLLTLIKDSESLEETRNIIKYNIPTIKNIVKEKLEELDYKEEFDIKYGANFFPEKQYKGLTYKSGNYESLVITIGEGKGDNFWCVLFPPLCLLESTENNSNEVEYKFFVKEIINRYFR